MKVFLSSLALLLTLGIYAPAATIAPEFAGSYTAVDLGSIAGLPARYGGLAFAAGDPN